MNTLSRISLICFCWILSLRQPSEAAVRGIAEDASQIPSSPRYWKIGDELTPNDLKDERNPSLGNSGLENKKKAVVLIHGWNPEAVEDRLNWAVEWRLLSDQLKYKLNESDSKRDWAIIHFNWSKAAATGPVFDLRKKSDISAAMAAAINGDTLGYSYAKALNESCPDLRRVHFIAHSAGSWLARRALMELMRLNPMVVCELTLLDPFVPHIPNYANQDFEILTNPAVFNYRLWKTQNIYANDLMTNVFTQGDLSWEGINVGTNFRIDSGVDILPRVMICDWGRTENSMLTDF